MLKAEQEVKQNSLNKYRLLWRLLALGFFAALAFPMRPAVVDGDSAYRARNFQEAAAAYEQELRTGVNADLYYNLGNAYYRLNNLPQAIKNYERALHLEPSHRDAAYNLRLCQAKSVDKFDARSEMFFVTWMRGFVFGRSADFWGYWGLGTLALTCAGVLVYLFTHRLWMRKSGLTLAVVAFLSCIFSNVAAGLAQRRFETLHRSVVVREVQLMDDAARPLRTLHEGTVVDVLDVSPDGTLHAELPDGKQGWMDGKCLEKIY